MSFSLQELSSGKLQSKWQCPQNSNIDENKWRQQNFEKKFYCIPNYAGGSTEWRSDKNAILPYHCKKYCGGMFFYVDRVQTNEDEFLPNSSQIVFKMEYNYNFERFDKAFKSYTAFGFVAYFLCYYEKKSIPQLFDEYYSLLFEEFKELKIKEEPILCLKDNFFFAKEFFIKHVQSEYKFIDQIRKKEQIKNSEKHCLNGKIKGMSQEVFEETYRKYEIEKLNIHGFFFNSIYNFLSEEDIKTVDKYAEAYLEYIEHKNNPNYGLNQEQIVRKETQISKKELPTMNYKHTVLTSFIENRDQKTPFASYFKSKAKFSEVNYFIEFPDFFNGCLHVIKLYKNEIQNKYQKRLSEGDYLLRSINSGKGMMKDGEHITDLNDERIQSTLKYFENDKKFVESRGYKNNFDFACFLTTTGEITHEFFEQEEKLHWYEIEQIEKGILQAQEELMVNFQEENKQNEVLILKDFFLNVNDEDFEQIITMIDKELDISNARTKTIALYTVALQKKGYLSKTINQTKFHKALKEKLGKKIVGRSNFSEKLTEITSGHYEKELEQYKNKLP